MILSTSYIQIFLYVHILKFMPVYESFKTLMCIEWHLLDPLVFCEQTASNS